MIKITWLKLSISFQCWVSLPRKKKPCSCRGHFSPFMKENHPVIIQSHSAHLCVCCFSEIQSVWCLPGTLNNQVFNGCLVIFHVQILNHPIETTCCIVLSSQVGHGSLRFLEVWQGGDGDSPRSWHCWIFGVEKNENGTVVFPYTKKHVDGCSSNKSIFW